MQFKCIGLILRHETDLLLGVHDALDGGVDVGDAVLAGQEAGGQRDPRAKTQVPGLRLTGISLGALPHVLLQGAGDAEGHVAVATLHDVLPRPAVCLHVPGELAGLGAGVGAELALVRLLPGVGAPVHRQVGAVLEHLAAILAGVLPPPPYQVFTSLRIKDSVQPTFLGQGSDGTGLHWGQIEALGQRGDGEVLH